MANPQPRGAQSKAFHPRRGEIYLVALDPTVGHEIKKTRPALVIQNDITNEYSGTTIVAPITSTVRLPLSPTHMLIVKGAPSGLDMTSVALCEQMRVADRTRLIKAIGYLDPKLIPQLDEAIAITLGLKGLF
jgi:mRNA interferase MazF